MNRYQLSAAAAALSAVLAAGDAAAQRGDFPEVRAGQPVQGLLDGSGPRLIDGKPFRVYQFQARTGRRYTAGMESGAFDSYLVLARPNGGITEEMKQNDDGGEGSNARLRFTVPRDGTYLLIARPYGSDSEGAFTLTLEDGGEIVTPQPAPARVGQTVRGQLSDTDGFLSETDKNYDLYVVRGDPGEDVHVLLASNDFDAYLEVGEMVNGAFQSEETNDDWRGRDAALGVRLGRTGEAYIRATSLGSDQTGSYTLTVTAGRLPPRPDDMDVEADAVEIAPATETRD